MTDKKLYDGVTRERWMEELGEQNVWNRRHLLSLFSLIGTPPNMFDVGCGNGAMVRMARQLGIDSWGIDQLVDETWENYDDWFFHHDLRKPFSLSERAGHSVVHMVLCLEVAEHISGEYHNILCDTIANHLQRGEGGGKLVLVFSSATPGQGGLLHESERPAPYWRTKFHERGLTFKPELTTKLALLWSNIDSPLFWLPANVQVFDK